MKIFLTDEIYYLNTTIYPSMTIKLPTIYEIKILP